MKFSLIAILILAAIPAFAQKQNVYFLKNDGTYVTNRDSADYIRIVREPDSASTLYNVLEFYPNGTRKLIGKSSRIDPPNFEGTCMTFDKNGRKTEIQNFKNNLPAGMQYEYFPNGRLYTAKKYAELKPQQYFESGDDYVYTDEYDSLGTVLIKDGNGYHKGYDGKFKTVLDEGPVKDGQPDGQWKGTDLGMHLRYAETYKNSALVSGISIGEKGETVRYEKARQTAPHFKGGVDAFGWYLGHNIKYPDYEKDHNIQGKVMLSFVVEKDGKVSEIKVIHSVTFNLDTEAARVIRESDKWIPGTAYGRPVRTVYYVPINFTLSD